MNWIVIILALGLVGFLLDREIYFYEGVHLGPRVQAWLYDHWSRKYDGDKRASQAQDSMLLAGPLLGALKDIPEPFILDFATGTGRLSYALLARTDFNGHIIAVDLSQGMLERAAEKLGRATSAARPGARVELLRHQTLPLPFPDAAFDAVCALEVLELFPAMLEPLQELSRVLRPGGVLLCSRGTEESGRRAKVKSKIEFAALLKKNGLEGIEITTWWRLFDRVMARKSGASDPAGRRGLVDVLRCAGCGQIQWQKAVDSLTCRGCESRLSISKQGIVLN